MKNNWVRKSLVFGIFLLFFGTAIIPSLAQNIEKLSSSQLKSNWLYVGGSGLGNYTKIQDAIDNASEGDVVFVYAGTYYEKIQILKSIVLLGENVNLTIIDIDHIYPQPQGGIVIHVINAPNVTIDGFSFKNHFSYDMTGGILAENCSGLTIRNINDSWHHAVDFGFRLCSSNHSTITQTFIKFKTESAIDIQGSLDVTISENYIFGSEGYLPHDCGISLEDCENILISNNTITKYKLYGISLVNSNKSNLVRNNVHDNNASGIYLLKSNNNIISNNEISSNINKGIFIECSKNNIISQNNIYNNGCELFFFLNAFYNKWNANFWGDASSKKQIIKGLIHLELLNIYFPIWKVDWHPAKEPFDISI
jgi:parallel beta-helix repeat protein